MIGRKVTSSASKRGVVFRVKDDPCPVRTAVGGQPLQPALYRLRGKETDPSAYVTDDGFSLIDLVATVNGSEAADGTASRTFRKMDTMLKALKESGLDVRLCSDGSIIAWGDGRFHYEPLHYESWLKGDVYRVAEVDDPSDDTGRAYYADDESEIPGRILKVKEYTQYDISHASIVAAKFGMDNQPKERWKFRIYVNSDYGEIGYDEAVRLGYDGRDLEIGHGMEAGPLIIERVEPELSDFTPNNWFRSKDGKGSKNRKGARK